MKRSVFIVFIVLMIGMLLINSNIFAATYNYGEALQKSIYFYECQQSGTLPDWNRARGLWRGDAQLGCAVQGGWVDAGDNVKFGLPMANSAAMLGWAYLEWSSAFTDSKQDTALKNNLKWVCDYFVRCDRGSNMCYQIGDGGIDHSFWGPVEVTEKKKGVYPAFYCKASCVTAETAAALALGYLVLGDSTYLTHAKSLFNLADATRSDADYTAANGYYNSWSGFWDELCFAAIWLYKATNDSSYLTKAESYVANFNKQGQTTDIEYQYGNSWDDNHYADLLLLTKITGKTEYKTAIENNLNWWTVGVNGAKITYTPGGLAWLQQWGPLRYSMNTSLLAFIYADYLTDPTLKARYQDFAVRQVNYCLGQNPSNRSYMVGFGNNPPVHPHHRTAHGSWSDQQTVPDHHRHTIYGALVGGPSSGDAYTDEISNYTTNEIACDYNAAFVGCLAKMYSLYGGTPLANFPTQDPLDDEFFVEAGINSTGPNYTEIKALCNNRSGFPARFVKNLNFVYYMDLSEVFAAGYTAKDVTVSTNYVEFPVTISPVTQYGGNVYYVKISFNDGTSIYPGGQSEYAGEIQFRISAPQNTTFWDPKNDYSYTGITNTVTKTKYIPVFDGSTLLYGSAPTTPDGTPTPRVTATPTVPVTPTPPVVTPTPPPTGYILNVTARSLTTLPLMTNSTVDINPPGGSYTYNQPINITYLNGTQVSLTANNATPSPGIVYDTCTFVRWEGDVSSTSSSITLTMNSNMSIVACYEVIRHDLRTPTPTPTPTFIPKTPTPPVGTPTPTVPVTPTPPVVTPTPPPTGFVLNVTGKSLTALPFMTNSTVYINPPGGSYNFNQPINITYLNGTQVSLTANNAIPSPGIVYDTCTFVRWEGDVSSYSSTITLTMNSNMSIVACYEVVRHDLRTPTPTPTPTFIPRTPTPPVVTPTPTPTPPIGAIKVQFYNQVTSATGNQIYANFKLVNIGTSAIGLSNVKIRYYYTIDGVKSQSFWCDYSPIGSSNVTGTFVTMSPAKTGADTYLEVGFTSGAGNLAAGSNIVIQTRTAKSDWSNYTHTNDYSFNSSATNYVDWTKVTGYLSGVLQWGIEP